MLPGRRPGRVVTQLPPKRPPRLDAPAALKLHEHDAACAQREDVTRAPAALTLRERSRDLARTEHKDVVRLLPQQAPRLGAPIALKPQKRTSQQQLQPPSLAQTPKRRRQETTPAVIVEDQASACLDPHCLPAQQVAVSATMCQQDFDILRCAAESKGETTYCASVSYPVTVPTVVCGSEQLCDGFCTVPIELNVQDVPAAACAFSYNWASNSNDGAITSERWNEGGARTWLLNEQSYHLYPGGPGTVTVDSFFQTIAGGTTTDGSIYRDFLVDEIPSSSFNSGSSVGTAMTITLVSFAPASVVTTQLTPQIIRIVADPSITTAVRITYTVAATFAKSIWKYRMRNSDQDSKLFIHHTVSC